MVHGSIKLPVQMSFVAEEFVGCIHGRQAEPRLRVSCEVLAFCHISLERASPFQAIVDSGDDETGVFFVSLFVHNLFRCFWGTTPPPYCSHLCIRKSNRTTTRHRIRNPQQDCRRTIRYSLDGQHSNLQFFRAAAPGRGGTVAFTTKAAFPLFTMKKAIKVW